MGTANVSCGLSNLRKFKCYTQSGSKKVYEDDGLTKEQSFIIFQNKTTLSTGECEYTIGLRSTSDLNNQHPWKDWTYTVPSNAVPGNTYSYDMTGEPIPLTNYKGVLVNGIPTKKWTWDIQTTQVINLSCSTHIPPDETTMQIMLKFNNNKYLGNDKLSVEVTITTTPPITIINSVFFTVTKYSIPPLRNYISLGTEVGKQYVVMITMCKPTSGNGYIVHY